MSTKIVAISGGAQGIGRALAVRFAQEGYNVSLLDTHKKAGLEVVKYIHQQGGQAMYMAGDVSVEPDVIKWLQLTVKELGGIHILINNAGIGINGSLLELPVEDFDRVIAVNLRGTFLCAKYAAKIMKNQQHGVIINLASTRALMSEPDTEAYAASKGGIVALTHALAVSLGRYGIRVNAISPGWIETGPWQYSSDAQQPDHTKQDAEQHPVGRVGIPDDIVQACLYLADDRSSFMTGQNLVIDGGMTVKMIYET